MLHTIISFYFVTSEVRRMLNRISFFSHHSFSSLLIMLVFLRRKSVLVRYHKRRRHESCERNWSSLWMGEFFIRRAFSNWNGHSTIPDRVSVSTRSAGPMLARSPTHRMILRLQVRPPRTIKGFEKCVGPLQFYRDANGVS